MYLLISFFFALLFAGLYFGWQYLNNSCQKELENYDLVKNKNQIDKVSEDLIRDLNLNVVLVTTKEKPSCDPSLIADVFRGYTKSIFIEKKSDKQVKELIRELQRANWKLTGYNEIIVDGVKQDPSQAGFDKEIGGVKYSLDLNWQLDYHAAYYKEFINIKNPENMIEIIIKN